MTTLLSAETGSRVALNRVRRRGPCQNAHESVARVQHVLAHDDRGFCGVAARHGLHEVGMLGVGNLHAPLQTELRAPERQKSNSKLKGLLDQKLIMSCFIDCFVKPSIELII